MEWIRRNPKAAIGLSALAVLCAVVLVWGFSGGSDSRPSALPTLGPPSDSSPSRTPLTALPTPSGVPTSASDVLSALDASSGSSFGSVTGTSHSLARHRVVLSAGSDGPLMAVGWWVPLADGERKGADTSQSRSFRHSAVTYGDGDFARVLAYGGSTSKRTWCTISVDGKVTERQEARGPWGQVFCRS